MQNASLSYSHDDMKNLANDLLRRVERAALRTSPLIAAAALDFFADILPQLNVSTDSEVARKGAEAMREAAIHHALNTAQMLRNMADSGTLPGTESIEKGTELN